MKDKDLLADAAKQDMEVNPMTGEQMQEMLARVYATPKELVAKLKSLNFPVKSHMAAVDSETAEIIKEIDACVKKVQIEYPQLKYPYISFQYKECLVDGQQFRYHLGDYRVVEAVIVTYKKGSIQK